MNRHIVLALGTFALIMLFLFPAWNPMKPTLEIQKAQLKDGYVNFEMNVIADWTKSCYVVVYGPFTFDKKGHEEGNNIYVLSSRSQLISDSLLLQENQTISKLHAELWCDQTKFVDVEKLL